MGNRNPTLVLKNSKPTNASCVSVTYGPENIEDNSDPPKSVYSDDIKMWYFVTSSWFILLEGQFRTLKTTSNKKQIMRMKQ